MASADFLPLHSWRFSFLSQDRYAKSTKKQKTVITKSMVLAVRSMNPPGRFLEKNPVTGLWADIGDERACEKASQRLRDAVKNGDLDPRIAALDKNSNANANLKEKNQATKVRSCFCARNSLRMCILFYSPVLLCSGKFTWRTQALQIQAFLGASP